MSTSNFVGFGEAQRVSSRYVNRIDTFFYYVCVPVGKIYALDVKRSRTRVSSGLNQLFWRVGSCLYVDYNVM